MFDFLQGLAAAISGKTRKKDQILFSTDTGELSFDIEQSGTVTRYTVKDQLAQSLDGKTLLIL